MLDLETMDRRAMLRDLEAAIERAQAEHSPEHIESCLVSWRRITGSLRADRAAAAQDVAH